MNARAKSMMREHKPTFCRICEPLCGMVATVEKGRLVALRPDKDHPLSAGFACQKGIAFTEVVNGDDDHVVADIVADRHGAGATTVDVSGLTRLRVQPASSGGTADDR